MPVLPVELYRPIVDQFDRDYPKFLIPLLTTCRLMHAEAERALYSHIALYEHKTKVIDEIMHCPRRCNHVRSFFMYETGGKVLWTKLSVAFSMMHNLVEADFTMCTPQIRLKQVFGHGAVKFRKLKCTFDYDHDLLDFFASQDKVTHFTWNGYTNIPPEYSDSDSGNESGTDSTDEEETILPAQPFPSHVFPHLTHLLGPMDNIRLVYSGRNISHLSLYSSQDVDFSLFYSSRSPNLRLRALSLYNTFDQTAIKELVMGCPNLRFLSCIINLEDVAQFAKSITPLLNLIFLMFHNIHGRNPRQFQLDEARMASEEVFRHSNSVIKFQVGRRMWQRGGNTDGVELWPGEEGIEDWRDAFEYA